MPSILTHPAVPLALGVALGPRLVPARLLWAGVALSVLPDADVVAFRLGIAYEDAFGHRGFTHSLAFAAVLACVTAFALRRTVAPWPVAALFLFVAAASHGVLDAFTTGGLGIAFAWPFSDVRVFAPVRVIMVSPISVSRFLSETGLAVLASELKWVWAPCAGMCAAVLLLRHTRRRV